MMAGESVSKESTIDVSLLIAVALRKYIHFSRKLGSGLELEPDEKLEFNSAEYMVPIWRGMEPRISENLNLREYESIELGTDQGWVRIGIGGKYLYYPFTLAMHPPPQDVLIELADAADRYRMFSDSIICLSGSAPLGGVVDSVGDLDLFEYSSAEVVSNALLQDNPKYRSESIVCLKAKIAQTESGWPERFPYTTKSDQIHYNKIRRYAAKLLHHNNFCKVDMVGNFGSMWGEVTNIVYKTDSEDANDDSPTHTFQEITVDREPLSNSASLKNFGKYAFFLRDEIEKTLVTLRQSPCYPDTGHSRKPAHNFLAVKATKRAINLCSILQRDHTDFAKFANSAVGQRYAATQLLEALKLILDHGATAGNAQEANKALQNIIQKLTDQENEDEPVFTIQSISSHLTDLIRYMDSVCLPMVGNGDDYDKEQEANA